MIENRRREKTLRTPSKHRNNIARVVFSTFFFFFLCRDPIPTLLGRY